MQSKMLLRNDCSTSFLLLLFSSMLSIIIAARLHEQDPTPSDIQKLKDAEIHMFGKTVAEMSSMEYTVIHSSKVETVVLGEKAAVYQLVNIPIVYHVVPNQNGGGRMRPSLTEKQMEWQTNSTTQQFNIYDRNTKKYFQFATYRTSTRRINRAFNVKKDCFDFEEEDFQSIIALVPEWQFKLHAIVCEINQYSGYAYLPTTLQLGDVRHNAVALDYRAIPCFDSAGNFLCETKHSNGTHKNISKTRWWTKSSGVLAHEIGHNFGLFHTFEGGCDDDYNDGVSDTPADGSDDRRGCPGLLPYDKDRDLFNMDDAKMFNQYTSTKECGYRDKNACTLSETCASCCSTNGKDCPRFRGLESISENVRQQNCCPDNTPIDTCPLKTGIDPRNNIMSYAPTYCYGEFTPGQLARMLAIVKEYKPYMYCNYANVKDVTTCKGIPCASTATSPNCVK